MTVAEEAAAARSHRATQQTRTKFRIAMVGCGPRGLFALEALSRKLLASGTTLPIAITIYDPAVHPGAGNVYAIDQPHFLRMNFASDRIDAWKKGNDRPNGSPSLVDWLAEHRPEMASPDGFVPRAVVGEYLHKCFLDVVQSLKPFAAIDMRREAVTSVERVETVWNLATATGSREFDEVVMAVGHEGWRPPTELPRVERNRLVDCVFPVQRQLSLARIRSGQRVAVRGFGLTSIDAILALTEGRGGRFRWSADECVYESSGDEPAVIIPYSRTGRPMLAKPVQSKMTLPAELRNVWRRGRATITGTRRPVDRRSFQRDIWKPIEESAARALQLVTNAHGGGGPDDTSQVREWFQGWRTATFDSQLALDVMRTSLSVATGRKQPDLAWAIGEAWRNLYPALVECVSHGGLGDEVWPDFQSVAGEMERLSFGPPAENLARILALVDAGIVDLRFVAGASITSDSTSLELATVRDATAVDVIVNAVIPSPLELSRQGPLSPMLQRGLIHRCNPFTGIKIDSSGRAVSDAHDDAEGLTVFGRVTEGCVLGNDTLNRELHPQIENWAASLLHRLSLRSIV